MELKKTYSTSLRVEDPISYGTNVWANAQTQVREQMKGACFHGMFVRDVELLRTSEVFLENVPVGSAVARVDVQVNLIGHSLGEGDLVPCVEIIDTETIVVGRANFPNPLIVSLLSPNEAIKVGSRLPARISECKHPPRQNNAVATVELLTRKSDEAWAIVGELTSQDLNGLAPLQARLRELHAENGKRRKDDPQFASEQDFYASLLTRTGTEPEGKRVDLLGDLKGAYHGVYVDPCTASPASMYLVQRESEVPPDTPQETPLTALARALHLKLQYAQLLSKMPEFYKSDDKKEYEKHTPIWELMRGT